MTNETAKTALIRKVRAVALSPWLHLSLPIAAFVYLWVKTGHPPTLDQVIAGLALIATNAGRVIYAATKTAEAIQGAADALKPEKEEPAAVPLDVPLPPPKPTPPPEPGR